MILARSPFVLAISGFPFVKDVDYVDLDLYIYQGDKVTDKPASATISIRKNYVKYGTSSNIVYIEISQIVKDYLENTFLPESSTNVYRTDPFWVEYDATVYFTDTTSTSWTDNDTVLAFNGYNYSKGDYSQVSDNILLSNNKLYVLDDNLVRIPVLRNEVGDYDVDFYKNGVLLGTETVTADDNTQQMVVYLTQLGSVIYDNFKGRVDSEIGSVFEDSNCNDLFFQKYSWGEADTIIVDGTKLQVCYIDSCSKYIPYKCTFYNKQGVLQDLYLTRKSMVSNQYSDEILKRTVRNDGFDVFDKYDFTYQRFNTNSKENLTLNTGFIDESYNEIVNQLMLSESVWLTNLDDEVAIPVVVKNKTLDVKTKLNDKLINYTIQFEYAHDVIETFF